MVQDKLASTRKQYDTTLGAGGAKSEELITLKEDVGIQVDS